MQSTSATNYALRVLICLYGKDGYTPASELAEKTGGGKACISRTLRKLHDTGWVDSVSGADGGYRLCVDTEAITVLDVMRAMDDFITFIYPVPQDGEYHPIFIKARKMYSRHQIQSEKYFGNITVKSLMP